MKIKNQSATNLAWNGFLGWRSISNNIQVDVVDFTSSNLIHRHPIVNGSVDHFGINRPDMSRPSSVSSRNLSLTEELERLEQSITLTLQGHTGRPFSPYPEAKVGKQRSIIISVAHIRLSRPVSYLSFNGTRTAQRRSGRVRRFGFYF